MINKKRIILFLGMWVGTITHMQAQISAPSHSVVKEKSDDDLLSMSLQDLMNVEIYSASKKAESVFQSPLSSTVITKEEILEAGSTSIPEALRLAPGLIVREYANGSYDIHLRGMDNVPSNLTFGDTQNLISLVMINNRIVYNYLNGGTFWDTFPVDLNDVDRIEIIRGPAAALYGPNAVAGVINIITRNPEKDGLYVVANTQVGNHNTQIGNGSVGYKKKIWSFVGSGNYQKRNRYDDLYYIIDRGAYVPLPDKVSKLAIGGSPDNNFTVRYPDPSLSMEKYGFNGSIHVKPTDKIDLELTGGHQNSRAQRIFTDIGVTPLSVNDNKSSYLNLSSTIHGFSTQLSHTWGSQEQVSGVSIPYRLTALNTEYTFTLHDLSVRPGISYNQASYEWATSVSNGDFTNLALSVRADYTRKQYRLIAALRGDKYNDPSKSYLSFQLGGYYNLSQKNLIRLIYSRANAAPFIFNTYAQVDAPIAPAGIGVAIEGNPDLKLTTMNMLEIGYRTQLTEKISLDIEGFYSMLGNFATILYDRNETRNNLNYTINKVKNLETRAKQVGLTANVNVVPMKNVQLKVFGTVQHTRLKKFIPKFADLSSTEDKEHTNTPAVYGGITAIVRPISKLTLNINSYYFARYTMDHEDYTIRLPFPPFTTTNYNVQDEVGGKMILNAKVSYQVQKHINVYVNARNLFANGHQFAMSDKIGTLILGGVHVEL